jgi:hypothetical protein
MAKLFPDVGGSAQNTPPVIPQLEIGADPGGDCELSAEWLDDHREKRLFQSLGTNNRVCFTCHQPQETAPRVPPTIRHLRRNERPIACFWTRA